MKPLYPLEGILSLNIDNVYATIALLLLSGLVFGYLAKLVRLPSITGYILAGLLLGPVFGIVDTQSPTIEAQFEPITNFALSLIAISIGSHLKFRILRNALKRIFTVGMVGTLVLPLVVFVACLSAMWLGPYPRTDIVSAALFMGILAIATAPATVVHVIKESQARGVFVKTLLAVVVFNNVTNIILFEGARNFVFGSALEHPMMGLVVEIGGAVVLGVVVASMVALAWRTTHTRQRLVTLSFSALIITYGLSLLLGLSPVIANLALGITIANIPSRPRILDIFEDFEVTIYTLFFTLMGTHGNFEDMGSVGILAAVYFLARTLGNLGTVYFSGRVTHMPRRVTKYLGLALMPQAGITVGLVVILESMDRSQAIAGFVTPAILLAVAFSEIIGPIILRFSLRRSGEMGQAKPRLIDFLQEEYITLDVKSTDREGVIRELVDLLFKTHHSLRKLDRKEFLQVVLEREEAASTAVGRGVAIPHGIIEGGSKILGVMAVVRDGVAWDSPDTEPVHMVILVATPPNHEEQHLGVLSTISQIFRRRSVTARKLHLARNEAEVYEALADEEFASLNQVLDEFTGTPTREQPTPDEETEPALG